MTPSMSRSAFVKAAAAVVLIAAAAKLNTLRAGFVWDDDSLICENPHVRNWRRIPLFFRPSFWRRCHMTRGEVYRPIRLASFALDYAAWGQRPAGYHLTNLIAHLINVALVCLLLRRWPLTRGFWLPAALLFALRPTDVETVAWIKNRSDLFAAGFFLAAILVLPLPLGERTSWPRSAVGAGLLVLAIMSKEVAVALPPLLMFALTSRTRWRRGWMMTLPLWAASVGYLLVRRYALVTPPAAAPGQAGPDLPHRVLNAATTLLCYARLTLTPVNLTLDHLAPARMLTSGGARLVAAALVCAACVAVVAAYRPRAAWAGAVWFALALAPVSNLIPLRDRPLAEQRLYVAALGFCLIAASAARGRAARAGLVAALALASACLAVHRAGAWESNLRLWTEAVRITPDKERPLSNLGNAYLLAGRGAAAERVFQAALRKHPRSTEAAYRLGQIRLARGEKKEAEKWFKRVIRWSPKNVEARFALAELYRGEGRYEDALSSYKEVLRVRPRSADAWHGIALVYDAQGDERRAVEACSKAIAINPAHVYARRVRGALRLESDPAAAVKDLSAALEVDPSFAPAYVDRARAFMKLGRFDRAQADLDAALLLNSSDTTAAELQDELRRRRREAGTKK